MKSNKLVIHLEVWQKQQNKPKENMWKKKKERGNSNEIENEYTIEMINKAQSWFLKKD